MKLGEPDPFTLKIITIVTGILFLAFAGMFFAHALQTWRRSPARALNAIFFGIIILIFVVVAIYLLLS